MALVCGLVLTLVITTVTVGVDGAAAERGVRVSVAGDSLALGIGASDSSRGFAFDLFRRIDAERPGSEVSNLAIGGTTAADVERLEVPRLAATHPDVVLLEVGANDAVRRRSAASFSRDFSSLVRVLHRVVPHAQIIIFNVPDIAVSPIFENAAKPKLRRLVAEYNLTVATAARRIGAPVVDLYTISERARHDIDRFFSADLFHPSDAGHEAIAAAAWPTVQRYEERR
jgi:lysophospholipase L1-like esterase